MGFGWDEENREDVWATNQIYMKKIEGSSLYLDSSLAEPKSMNLVIQRFLGH